MNRNTETHFGYNPTGLDMRRSTMDESYSHTTTFNVGDLIPIYVQEVLPGDTWKVDTSMVLRLQTLIAPPMDNLFLDTYFFFVPNRLVWDHWQEFCGENTSSAWIPSVDYVIPIINAPQNGWNVGSIADYMGIPTGVDNFSVNALPIRSYALVCEQWFRSENLTDPLDIPTTDSTVTGSNGSNYITDVAKGGLPFKAAKVADYFTMALPSPQRGPDVAIPVAERSNLPVMALEDEYSAEDQVAIIFNKFGETTDTYKRNLAAMNIATPQWATLSSSATNAAAPVNLWAVDDGSAVAATINQLRIAFQVQRFYEKQARGGTRYISLLKTHFGVSSPDARLQRAEYLGGKRVPISIQQVVQQSETASTPQGNTAAFSLTTDTNHDFTKSFVEHGHIIGVCVARYHHTYQQGLDRMWSRRDKFDFYWPVFANIGEQAILNKEIFLQGSSVTDSDGNPVDGKAFGYQEAWAEYRYKPNRVSGMMRSEYSQPLDMWHFADDYSQLPTLSDAWIREDKSNVDRSLAVQSSVSNQILADFYFKQSATRVMPLYSIPGLIDHH